MNRNERTVLIVLALLLLLGLFFWRMSSEKKTSPAVTVPAVVVSTPTAVIPSSAPVVAPPHVTPVPAPPKPKPTPSKPTPPKPTAPATTSTGAPVPPKLELHKELIPKNIEIVRCYYTEEVVTPGRVFGFDINGSGFTKEFEKMIKVESGHEHVVIKNLHLITANQIHGDMDVGAQAKTGFVYPRVLIQKLPVFRAPDPFAVVRKGEVLTVFFVSMEENGRGGKFRVITNLDEASAKTFRIVTSTPSIRISDLHSNLPYLMEGHLQIEPGVPPGDQGLTIFIHGKEAFKRMGMIRIVHPNIGQTGFVQGLITEEKYHRPGDAIQIYVQGTGLSPQDTSNLDAKVAEFDIGKASFTYISPLQLRLTFYSPMTIPLGSYGVRILSRTGQMLFEKMDLFKIVPADWVAGVQVSPPVRAGGRSTLKVLGRDFSDTFATSLRIEVDDPGIVITNLRRADASSIMADIQVGTGVAPGDYWLHLSAQGQKIAPPFGSIIKVEKSF